MDLLYPVLLGLFLLVVLLATLKGLRWAKESEPQPADDAAAREEVVSDRKGGRLARMRRRVQNRQQSEATPSASADGADADESNEDYTEEEWEHFASPEFVPQSREERMLKHKAEKRLRKKYQREQQAARIESQSTKVSKYEEKQRLREQEREEKERIEREEEEKKRLEQEKKEQEEYDKWKDMMSLDEEGTGEANDMAESQGLLQEFVSYIETSKICVLDELAAEFGLTVEECINRVRNLMDMEYISGVLDDRGKFISITNEELENVATFIKRRGRVSVDDLVREAKNLIDLSSKDVESRIVVEDDDAEEGEKAADPAATTAA